MRLTFLCAFLFIPVLLFAQEKRNYTASTSENLKINIDGNFDEPAWQNAHWDDDFVQFEPREGEPPAKKTEFAILYDAANIYVAIRAYDDPDSISMRMTRRDNQDGDWVGLGIDSYFDKRTFFGFFVTAAGVRSDQVSSNDGNDEDTTWDAIWWVKTKVTKTGWNAEFQIPLTQLRFKESDEQHWGLQVVRYIFRNDELSAWQPMSHKISGITHQFGTMNGIKNIKPRNVLDVTPYAVARTERFEKDPENPFLSDGKKNAFNAGLDAKIGLTNFLTMDLTVNPDFGQVEADPSQVNLTTFETFFAEKRPFFVEGKNILSYSLSFGDGDLSRNNLFYSRRIGRRPQYYPDLQDGEYADQPEFTRILGAAKITGKTQNGWSVGVLESVTSEEKAKIEGIGKGYKQSVEPFTNYFVSRVQKDFNEGNTYIGGMVTAVNRTINDPQLEFLHKSAYSAGFDLVHKWHEKDWLIDFGLYGSRVAGTEEAILNTQTMYSRTFQRPDADYVTLDSSRTSLSGTGGKFTFGKVGGSFQFALISNWKSPGLEINDIGYSSSVDEILQIIWAGYRWFEPVSVFRNANLNFNQWTAYDFGGNLLNVGGSLNGHAQFKNYWNCFFNVNWDGENLSHAVLRGGPSMKLPGSSGFYTGFFSNPQKKITYGIDGGMTFQNQKGYGWNKSFETEVGYRPIESLQIEISPEYAVQKGKLQYVAQVDYLNDKRYIMASIHRKTLSTSLRVNYSITPDLTIQFWGQPFIATGDYSEFKNIDNPMSDQIDDRYSVYDPDQISYNESGEMYEIDENRDGTTDYSFDKPDFNVKEFLSNMVLRWEYQPGSMIYLVWSQNRSDYENLGRFDFAHDVNNLFDTTPHNVFLVKWSYRFGR